MNLQMVALVAAQECERQRVGIQQLSFLLTAYGWAYHFSNNLGAFEVRDIQNIGELVEPDMGFIRQTPVTFQNGGSSANWWDIFSLLETLCDNLPEKGDAAHVNEWVKQFLWIHPFRDGNGRTGWILYNLFMGTMDDPTNLPNYFGE